MPFVRAKSSASSLKVSRNCTQTMIRQPRFQHQSCVVDMRLAMLTNNTLLTVLCGKVRGHPPDTAICIHGQDYEVLRLCGCETSREIGKKFRLLSGRGILLHCISVRVGESHRPVISVFEIEPDGNDSRRFSNKLLATLFPAFVSTGTQTETNAPFSAGGRNLFIETSVHQVYLGFSVIKLLPSGSCHPGFTNTRTQKLTFCKCARKLRPFVGPS